MRLLFKLSLVTVFIGSIFLTFLLCGVFADFFSLKFPGWVRFGIVASILIFGLIALATGLLLWPRKSRHDYSVDPPLIPKAKEGSGTDTTAFTLLELLMVVALIGVLATLLLTGLASTKGKARRTQCASNLKQQGLALQ
jgi:prepilin-type N-terminal cleavage/methylation domain-containing protein